jgi:lysophospholipase L1-like esterase
MRAALVRLRWRAMPTRLALALVLLLVLPTAAQAAKKRSYYVSLGDSYAVGYQATGQGQSKTTRKGYADQLVRNARARGHRLTLVNFGCGGETTSSILQRKTRCRGSAPGAPSYAGRTQVAAAERFLRRHRGRVTLITVSIGGNDVTACAREADPVPCVAAAVEGIETNGKALVKRLRKAAGPKARIVGITYPDVILGEWVGATPNRDLAALSVVAFKSLINPALKEVYESVRGRFVDVTEATGAYGSLEEMTTLDPYGEIPVPVAEVCKLTYYCSYRDIHANTKGYGIIADLIARTLPRKRNG